MSSEQCSISAVNRVEGLVVRGGAGSVEGAAAYEWSSFSPRGLQTGPHQSARLSTGGWAMPAGSQPRGFRCTVRALSHDRLIDTLTRNETTGPWTHTNTAYPTAHTHPPNTSGPLGPWHPAPGWSQKSDHSRLHSLAHTHKVSPASLFSALSPFICFSQPRQKVDIGLWTREYVFKILPFNNMCTWLRWVRDCGYS